MACTDEGLQGHLIHHLAEAVGDPDKPVRTWLKEASVPLGIAKPMKPGRVFPQALPLDSEAILDHWQVPTNYLSYGSTEQAPKRSFARIGKLDGWTGVRPLQNWSKLTGQSHSIG